MYKLILLILFPLCVNASDLDNYIIPWGYVTLENYQGSSTPSYLNLSGDKMLVGGIDMEINFPIYYKYLYVGMGVYAQANTFQFSQQLGKFWLGSAITKNVSLIFMHHSSHNLDYSMPNELVPFTTLDMIQLRFQFGVEPRR